MFFKFISNNIDKIFLYYNKLHKNNNKKNNILKLENINNYKYFKINESNIILKLENNNACNHINNII